MPGYQREIVIQAKPSDVVAFVLDPKTAPAVIEGVTEMVKLDDGPVGVGTRFRETRVMQGKPHTAEMEVVAFHPEAGYTIRSQVSGIEVTYRYDVRPHDGGS